MIIRIMSCDIEPRPIVGMASRQAYNTVGVVTPQVDSLGVVRAGHLPSRCAWAQVKAGLKDHELVSHSERDGEVRSLGMPGSPSGFTKELQTALDAAITSRVTSRLNLPPLMDPAHLATGIQHWLCPGSVAVSHWETKITIKPSGGNAL